MHIIFVHIPLAEDLGKFPTAVGPEIEKDHHIPFPDGCQGIAP